MFFLFCVLVHVFHVFFFVEFMMRYDEILPMMFDLPGVTRRCLGDIPASLKSILKRPQMASHLTSLWQVILFAEV